MIVCVGVARSDVGARVAHGFVFVACIDNALDVSAGLGSIDNASKCARVRHVDGSIVSVRMNNLARGRYE